MRCVDVPLTLRRGPVASAESTTVRRPGTGPVPTVRARGPIPIRTGRPGTIPARRRRKGGQVGVRFEELAWRETPIGAISLRRRRDPALDVDVYEVKLDDEYLMSSLFPVAEIELARLGLAAAGDEPLDVVVGGLGLGYTARTALEDTRVRSVLVVETIEDVIDWHRPPTAPLRRRPRPATRGPGSCRADFFAAVADGSGFDPDRPGRRFHAVLLDVDHSPRQRAAPQPRRLLHRRGPAPAGRPAAARRGVRALVRRPAGRRLRRILAEVFPTCRRTSSRSPTR